MTTYKVTTELKTPWWKRLFRFFRFIAPRQEFEINLAYGGYWYGDIISGNLILDIYHWTTEDFINGVIKEIDEL